MRWKSKTAPIFGFAIMVWTLHYCMKVLMQGTSNVSEVKSIYTTSSKKIVPIVRVPEGSLPYSYSTDDRSQIIGRPNTTVDISRETDLEDLNSRTIIASGFGQASAHVGLGMIASVHAHMPNNKIIIYNLGIHPNTLKTMKAMCNVEVRKFQYNKYPHHVQVHENNAWKLLAIKDLLAEYGVVFFVSPLIRFRAPISLLLPFVKEHHGIIGQVDHSSLTIDVTHPRLYSIFGLTWKNFVKSFPHNPMLSGDAILLVNNSAIYSTMIQPLAVCASQPKCIAPSGSTVYSVKPVGRKHTHRFEMSALTLLMYKNFKDKWVTDTHVQELMGRLQQRAPLYVNDHQWAHYCNPSKKEVNCATNKGRC